MILMLPRKIESAIARNKNVRQDMLEEARVYYVGATRVKKRFEHGIAATLADTQKLAADNDREVGIPWSRLKLAKFQIGRDGDLAVDRTISARTEWCEDDDVADEDSSTW